MLSNRPNQHREFPENSMAHKRFELSNDIAMTLGSEEKVLYDDQREVMSNVFTNVSSKIESVINGPILPYKDGDLSRIKASRKGIDLYFKKALNSLSDRWYLELINQINEPDQYTRTQNVLALQRKYTDEARNYLKTAESIIAFMKTEKGRITAEALIKLEKEVPKYVIIMQNDEDLLTALLYSFAYVEGGQSLEGKKEEVFNILAVKRAMYPGATWTIVKNFSKKDKKDFLTYLKENDGDDIENIINEGGRYGALDTVSVAEFTEENGILLSENQINTISEYYIAQNDFSKAAEETYKKSIGAENVILNSFNLKNLVMLVGTVAGGATVVANLTLDIAQMVKKKKFTPETALTNPFTVAGAVTAVGLGTALSGGGMDAVKDFLTENDNGGVEARRKFMVYLSNPDIKSVFNNNIAMPYALSSFASKLLENAKGDSSKIDFSKVSKNDFLDYLYIQAGQEKGQNRTEIVELMDALKSSDISDKEISSLLKSSLELGFSSGTINDSQNKYLTVLQSL